MCRYDMSKCVVNIRYSSGDKSMAGARTVNRVDFPGQIVDKRAKQLLMRARGFRVPTNRQVGKGEDHLAQTWALRSVSMEHTMLHDPSDRSARREQKLSVRAACDYVGETYVRLRDEENPSRVCIAFNPSSAPVHLLLLLLLSIEIYDELNNNRTVSAKK